MGKELIISTFTGSKSTRRITPNELKKLGYIFSSKRIGLGKLEEKEASYIINEVLLEDTERAATFSYLYSIDNQTGIILNHPFEYYHKMVFPNGDDSA